MRGASAKFCVPCSSLFVQRCSHGPLAWRTHLVCAGAADGMQHSHHGVAICKGGGRPAVRLPDYALHQLKVQHHPDRSQQRGMARTPCMQMGECRCGSYEGSGGDPAMLHRCMLVLTRAAHQSSFLASSPALHSIKGRTDLRRHWSLCQSTWPAPAPRPHLSQCASQLRSPSPASARHPRIRQTCEHGVGSKCCCVGGRRFHDTPLRQAGAVLLRSSRSAALGSVRDTSGAHSSTANMDASSTAPHAKGHLLPEDGLPQDGSHGHSVLLHERLWMPQDSDGREPSAGPAVTAQEDQLRPAQASILDCGRLSKRSPADRHMCCAFAAAPSRLELRLHGRVAAHAAGGLDRGVRKRGRRRGAAADGAPGPRRARGDGAAAVDRRAPAPGRRPCQVCVLC